MPYRIFKYILRILLCPLYILSIVLDNPYNVIPNSNLVVRFIDIPAR